MSAVVTFPCWERAPLAANDRNDRRSGGYRKFNETKNQARWCIRRARITPPTGPVVATLHYRMPDRIHRDADGLFPTMKAVLDAAVAEELLAGDDHRYVPEVRIRLYAPTHGNGELWLTLEEVWQR